LLKINPAKSDRGHVSLVDVALVRHWTRIFGRSREDIAAAIDKVGNNVDSVRHELNRKAGPDLPQCRTP